MLAEVPLFLLLRIGYGHIVNDVLLTAAFDAIVAKLEWINISIEQLKSVRALIHQVNFC